MRPTNRLIALLLALVLAFGLTLPTLAEGDGPINWDDFYIITPPQDQTVAYGESIVLSVEANAPAGTTLTYKWTHGDDHIGYESSIRLSPSDPGYPTLTPYYNARENYLCYVTASATNADGGGRLTLCRVSATVLAEREATFWEALKEKWNGFWTVVLVFLGNGILFPLMLPFLYIFGKLK